MKYLATFTVICHSFLMASCTYDAKTNKTSFTPLGAGPHEMIDVIAHDVKECMNSSCETKTSHDDYEESKLKSMSNEELDEYIKKQKSKL